MGLGFGSVGGFRGILRYKAGQRHMTLQISKHVQEYTATKSVFCFLQELELHDACCLIFVLLLESAELQSGLTRCADNTHQTPTKQIKITTEVTQNSVITMYYSMLILAVLYLQSVWPTPLRRAMSMSRGGDVYK